MKYSIRIIKFTAMSLCLFISLPGPGADTVPVKVVKTKKGLAIIKHPKKHQLQKGKKYKIVPWDTQVGGAAPAVENKADWVVSRIKTIGFSANILSLSQTVKGTDATTDLKTLDLNVLYGWNKLQFEYGPFLQYQFGTEGEIDSSTLLAGFFADYNFSRNTADVSGVAGARLALGFGIQDHSNQSEAGSVTRMEPSLFYKWFGLSTSTAMVLQLGFLSESAKIAETEFERSGLFGRIGIQTYY